MTTELTGNWGAQFAACLRLMLVSAVILCVLYPLVILAVGRTFTPWTAAGSLLLNERGQVVGSAQIAQAFTRPEYFWPRPSAVDYAANATGGSNLSPAGDALRERALESLKSLEATPQRKVPADLVTASGSGSAHYPESRALAGGARGPRARPGTFGRGGIGGQPGRNARRRAEQRAPGQCAQAEYGSGPSKRHD